MTLLDEHTNQQGDYVLVPRRKLKLTRMRTMVVGFMAVAAVAAVAGAGTFASFSASTNNDASFNTGRIVLKNTKTSGTACFSDSSSASGAEDAANLDTNDNTNCDALFTSNLKPGDTATSTLTIENKGDFAGSLYLFGV